MHFYW